MIALQLRGISMSIISHDRSRNGRATRPATADNGVTAKEAADFLGISLPTFWRRVADGRISQPYYPAERTPRWIPSKLREDRERMTMTPAEAKDRRHKAKLARRAAAEALPHNRYPSPALGERRRRRGSISWGKLGRVLPSVRPPFTSPAFPQRGKVHGEGNTDQKSLAGDAPGPRRWRQLLRIHPACELFPLLPDDELRVLGEDIKKHGLLTPIVFGTGGLPPGLRAQGFCQRLPA